MNKTKKGGLSRTIAISGFLFTLPWIIGLLIFYAYPLISSVYYSFTSYSVINPGRWVGLNNYRLLMQDDLFWISLGNTLFFAVFSVPVNIVFGVSVALLLNTRIRGLGFYRTIFFVPTLVPVVATAVVWKWILNTQNGIINALIRMTGFTAVPFLTDPAWTKPSLVLIAMWGIGQPIVTYLAGLQDIPADLYESADLDGAKWFHKIRYVTLPLLSPIVFYNVIMGTIVSLQIFALPYALMSRLFTAGDSMVFYITHLYNNAFGYMRMGYASAMAWILFVIILAVTLLLFRISRRWVYYHGE